MKVYDAIIIGAGPAGLNCAEKLAKANKKVLLLEQKEVIGPKVCAGGLLSHDLKYLKLPDEMVDCKFKEATLHTPFNKDTIKLDKYFVYTIDRKNLGQWQLSKLKKTSAVIRTNSMVTKIGKNYVVVNNSEKIKFKYLVGADGSSSIVRRFLGLKTNKLDIAMQYVIPTKKYKKVEFFFNSNLFHSWYAWIFPHKGYVSIGCGCDPKFLKSKKLSVNFHKWLEANKIDVSKGEYQAHPINFDFDGYKFKNIFLVGDAAGLASGLTGEGIYQALISGEEIAKMIINKKYLSNKMEELIKLKKLQDGLLNFLEKSGPIRGLEYEFLALLLKNKLIDKWFINTFA